MRSTPIDQAREAGEKAVEEIKAFRKDARKKIRGGVPKGHQDLKGDELARWIDLKVNQQIGFVADEMGNAVLDAMGQQQMVEWTPQGWQPMTYEYGPDWWALMNHPNVEGGKDLVRQYRAARKREFERVIEEVTNG